MATKKYAKRAKKIEKKQTDYERGVVDGRRAMRTKIADVAVSVGLALVRAFLTPPSPPATGPSTPVRTGASPLPAVGRVSRPVAGVATGPRPFGCGFYDPELSAPPDASSSKRTGDRSE